MLSDNIDTSDKEPGEPTLVKIWFGSQEISRFVVDGEDTAPIKDIPSIGQKPKPYPCRIPNKDTAHTILAGDAIETGGQANLQTKTSSSTK